MTASTMPDDAPRRIFLSGCQRGGTTFFQSFFAAHPQLHSFPETMFFRFLVGQADHRLWGKSIFSSWRDLKDAWRVRRGVSYRQGEQARGLLAQFLTDIHREDLIPTLPERSPRMQPFVDAFVNLLDGLARDKEKQGWVEKTPRHLHFLDIITQTVPGARCVFILRQGKDNVASLYDMAKRYPDRDWWAVFADIDRCVTYWNLCARDAQRWANHSQCLAVSYDRFVADPEPALRKICSHIGVDYSEEMINKRADAGKSILNRDAEFQKQILSPIDKNRATKFDRLFDDQQKQHILAGLKPVDWDLFL